MTLSGIAQALAASSFYIAGAGGASPHYFSFDGTTGVLSASPQFPWIDSGTNGLAIRPGDGLYFSAQLLELGTIVRADGSSLVPLQSPGAPTVPGAIAFGSDDSLYVIGQTFSPQPGETPSAYVSRHSGATGSFLGNVIPPGALPYPASDLTVRAGKLYVLENDAVLRFDALTGAPEGTFATFASGGMRFMRFGPAGDLFVSAGDKILRFSGDGRLLSTFAGGAAVGLHRAAGLDFGADGDLYVVDDVDKDVLRFDGATGALVEEVVAITAPGFRTEGLAPTFLVAVPVPEPQSRVLLLAGLPLLALLMRQRRKGTADRRARGDRGPGARS